jgi:hypothetical protein
VRRVKAIAVMLTIPQMRCHDSRLKQFKAIAEEKQTN